MNKHLNHIYTDEPWTAYEEYLVMSHITTDEQLSNFINRSLNSIHIKRSRLLNKIIKEKE